MMEKVLQGDCLDILPTFETESIDLIYLDPPFFTNTIQKLKTRDGSKEFSYSDIWESHKEYAEFLYKRLKELKRVLKQDGSIFVHCDKNSTHIVKALLDDIFGLKQFQSEIIWYYKRWSNSKKGLLPSHQTIYFYSKTKDFKFKRVYNDYSQTTNIDQILQKRVKDGNGKTVYAKDKNGNTINSDIKKGVPLNDVWEIPYLNPKAKERVGYPTQKPILLLERIIEIASNEGDTILDPFCGSGTTLVAGKLNNRKVIGIDKSEDAINITKSRLDNPIKSESNLLKKGKKAYQNVSDMVEKLLYDIDYIPVQRNSGIDAILKETYKNSPILIRIQKENETIEEAIKSLSRAVISKASKKSFLIRTNNIKSLFEFDYIDDKIKIINSLSYELKFS
ncbi:DNA modification methyltransferase [hydrothermal vent metagenome]|uniref:DNA modification methyltransferase n=1 Tax=hydrothermal vent metagenome TaxID=652676 RepID=A0A1W1EHM7_9ZZZZ